MAIPRECVEATADHIARCPSCRATAAALVVVRRASVEGVPDLWPRLRARIARWDESVHVVVRIPALGWQAAAAIAAVAVTAALAPEPGRLLAVMLGMV